jgi:SAM-dependent methyltransferase
MIAAEISAALDVLVQGQVLAQNKEAGRLRDHLWRNAEHLRQYLWSFEVENAPAGLSERYVNDALARFIRTLEFVPLPPGERVLEIGSNPYFFHILLHKLFPNCNIQGTNYFDHDVFSAQVGAMTQRTRSQAFQEEYEFASTLLNIETTPVYPFPDGTFDLVFFCETLEHLIVEPLSVFGKIRRILKPGGHLIITLPNAVRLTNFALMLEGYNFFDVYSSNGINGRHNREFTLQELIALVSENGYRIVRAETWDRFDYDQIDIWSSDYTGVSDKLARRKSDLITMLKRCGGKLTDRGDNLYILAQVPV